MPKNSVRTSLKIARKASRVLRKSRSKTNRSLAGSDLVNRKKR